MLYWSKFDDDRHWHTQDMGSMMRTPKVPVWLIYLNRRFALVFSTNVNLLNNWIYENYFQLHIYTGLKKQDEPCIISIDTRQQYPASIYVNPLDDHDQHSPAIIQLLQTRSVETLFDMIFNSVVMIVSRWPGCTIENADEIVHELMTLF
jgi:hypothetical protein